MTFSWLMPSKESCDEVKVGEFGCLESVGCSCITRRAHGHSLTCEKKFRNGFLMLLTRHSVVIAVESKTKTRALRA